jgi:hypothetical protein
VPTGGSAWAEGCPAHGQYCYLAGSLSGLEPYVGQGTVTSRSAQRVAEGTTFEASCWTDPLALEHLTGSWEQAVRAYRVGVTLAPLMPVPDWRTHYGLLLDPLAGIRRPGWRWTSNGAA